MQVQHVRTEDGRDRVVYTYQLSRGQTEERNYGGLRFFLVFLNYICLIWIINEAVWLGIRAAEMTNFPSKIIQEAKTVAAKINQKLWVCFFLFMTHE